MSLWKFSWWLLQVHGDISYFGSVYWNNEGTPKIKNTNKYSGSFLCLMYILVCDTGDVSGVGSTPVFRWFFSYEGRLQGPRTHLITPSRNFVEVRWQSLFRSTTLVKRYASCNTPPTSGKRAADGWSLRNFLPRSSCSSLEKPEVAWGEMWMELCVRLGKHESVKLHYNIRDRVQISSHAISGLVQPWKMSSGARNFDVINGLQHVFKKWVERCKKCIACQGRYFEKETVTAPPQSSDSE
jgi:hypothetical protein